MVIAVCVRNVIHYNASDRIEILTRFVKLATFNCYVRRSQRVHYSGFDVKRHRPSFLRNETMRERMQISAKEKNRYD